MCTFWTLCSHVCEPNLLWKVLENEFCESWKILEFCLCKSWKTVFYCLYEPWSVCFVCTQKGKVLELSTPTLWQNSACMHWSWCPKVKVAGLWSVLPVWVCMSIWLLKFLVECSLLCCQVQWHPELGTNQHGTKCGQAQEIMSVGEDCHWIYVRGDRAIALISHSCSVIFTVSASSRVRFRVRVTIRVRDPLCASNIIHCNLAW